MLLAHGGEGGAANFEALVLAIPMVVVGVILFAQKAAKPIVPVALVLGGFAIAVGGFTVLKPAAVEEHSDAEIAYGEMLASLCEARMVAADGEVDDAGAIFEDDVHVRLHDLADRLSDDRAAAGRLLEAKQVVEADLDRLVEPEELSSDLGDLIVATEAGLDSLDLEVDGCE